MKNAWKQVFPVGVLAGVLLAGAAWGEVAGLQAIDAGGGQATSANAAADQSIGGAVGISTSSAVVVRHGYVGQLYDTMAFAAVPAETEVDEADSLQVDGLATLDDDTLLAVDGSEVSWQPAAFPLSAVSAAGVATASNVYEDTPASVTGSYFEVEGEGSFWVRNTDNDDFGSYAADGLPDDWQVGYFGVGNTDAGPTHNVDDDPYDNESEWIADTDPTDSNSFFHITIVSNQSGNAEVWFESSAERVYGLESKTNLVDADWQSVDGQTNVGGNGSMVSLVESNAPVGFHYYRVGVQVP